MTEPDRSVSQFNLQTVSTGNDYGDGRAQACKRLPRTLNPGFRLQHHRTETKLYMPTSHSNWQKKSLSGQADVSRSRDNDYYQTGNESYRNNAAESAIRAERDRVRRADEAEDERYRSHVAARSESQVSDLLRLAHTEAEPLTEAAAAPDMDYYDRLVQRLMDPSDTATPVPPVAIAIAPSTSTVDSDGEVDWPCRDFFGGGGCSYGLVCKYSHGPKALRDKFASCACRDYFAAHGCYRGELCKYSHDPSSLHKATQAQIDAMKQRTLASQSRVTLQRAATSQRNVAQRSVQDAAANAPDLEARLAELEAEHQVRVAELQAELALLRAEATWADQW